MRRLALLLVASLAAGCSSPRAAEPVAPTPAPVVPSGGPTSADLDRLDMLIAWMTGSFDSAEQAAADRSYYDIRMHVAQIWTERPGGSSGSVRWLYVEQAMADQQSRPYRQRVYRVSALGGGVFKSEVLELPGDPLTYAGAWKTPATFASIKEDQLVSRGVLGDADRPQGRLQRRHTRSGLLQQRAGSRVLDQRNDDHRRLDDLLGPRLRRKRQAGLGRDQERLCIPPTRPLTVTANED
ncbi:MAG: chromophore lyase CpcT/CpeT [Phycisphaerales bacterium]